MESCAALQDWPWTRELPGVDVKRKAGDGYSDLGCCVLPFALVLRYNKRLLGWTTSKDLTPSILPGVLQAGDKDVPSSSRYQLVQPCLHHPCRACGSCDWFGVFEMTHLQSMTKSCVKHEASLLHHLGPVGQLVLLSPGQNRGTATACRPLAVQSQPGGAAEDEGFSGFCSSSLFFSCFFPCPERVAYCSAAEDYFPIWVTAVHLLGWV